MKTLILLRHAKAEYPVATVAEITLRVAHWRDVEAGGRRLRRFSRPRDLDPALGPVVSTS